MNLTPGMRLGPYEVLAQLGAGGMGEVWRARDTRLGRDVAIKVLAPHLTANAEVRTRFEREARTVSALAHPNICVIHDVGREGDTDYIVMELVEGETLAARLARGTLAPAEALTIGIQVADALDRAHRAGVVHRDLKPGNVMLTRSGAKLMDFGLARSAGMAGAPGSGASLTAMTHSPTMATPLTTEGSLIGTFQYMSPEQLEGREADTRSDLWALGCVLYEMIAGRRAFEGRSQASLIGSIMGSEPAPLEQAAPLAPPALARTIRACLAKDPDQRIQTAHDVKLQLQWAAEGGSAAGVPAPVAARRRSRERTAWITAAALGVALVAVSGLLLLRRPEPPQVMRFDLHVPPRLAGMSWPRVSPDGRMVAFRGRDSTGTAALWVRPVDAFEAHLLDGTAPSNRSFWSPDSRYLAYIVDGKLRKVPVAGGPPMTVCDAPGGSDGDWGTGDLIVFDGSGGDSIRYVPASGGEVRPASFIDHKGGESNHAWPHFLPDGKHFLFVAYSASGNEGTIKVGEIGSRESRVIAHTSGRVEYAQGYLLYPREGTLMAQPFDANGLKTTGDAVPVGEHISMGNAAGQFSVSTNGVLTYQVQDVAAPGRLEWLDRNGHSLGEAAPPGGYHDVALSADGRFVAFGFSSGGDERQDIWVRDLERGVSSRVTFGQGNNIWPVWSPDGRRIAYSSDRGGEFRVYVRLASGEGGDDSLAHVAGGPEGPVDWLPDGHTLITEYYRSGAAEPHLTPADGKGPAVTLMTGRFSLTSAHASPDGHWLAYESNETGRSELYLTTLPSPSGKWQVSTGGGEWPYWRADGRELFFRAADGTLMATPIDFAAGSPRISTPVALFRPTLDSDPQRRNRWVPAANGQRFLVNVSLSVSASQHFAVVTNWTRELVRK